MIDINNDDMTQNHTFIHQIHTNDDTNMMTNDFDRYDQRNDDIKEIKKKIIYLVVFFSNIFLLMIFYKFN